MKAQPPGSGAKVQSPATLLWGLTPVCLRLYFGAFTLGPDPSMLATLLWGLTPGCTPRLRLVDGGFACVVAASVATAAAALL